MADDDPPGSKPEAGEIIQFYKAREQKADSGEIELSDWNPWAHTGGPVFPLETLPDVMRARVEERAQTTGADVSAFAVAAFMGLSAASDHRIALRPKRHDHSYYIHPVLWTMLIADPSTRKSAPVEDIASLVREIDMRAGKARDHKVEKARQQQPGLSEQDLEKKIPMARRRLLNDTTSEMLCEDSFAPGLRHHAVSRRAVGVDRQHREIRRRQPGKRTGPLHMACRPWRRSLPAGPHRRRQSFRRQPVMRHPWRLPAATPGRNRSPRQ